ncbi:uncharacterized protein LOC134189984 isoform X2 [Corticium candelabrum]|uniref:uncharacterized protein LOC134189984 isoform X2 n=1 Tax=Corticium candelabrum TaxID=121492 RepID=UPI002E26CD55|nr:uncharacterized protein LOC134189984 isoform X2 [Corticium candelabrum]
MCQEGGCGACAVALTRKDRSSGCTVTTAVNSCLYSICSLQPGDGVTTTEGIGSQSKGFHAVQLSLAEHNGSQCGYCSPGMVMTMYSLLKENSSPNSQQIEDCFDGNICRCTGYRGILDGMHVFGKGSLPHDIEEIAEVKYKGCPLAGTKLPTRLPYWYTPSSVNDVFALLKKYATAGVMIVAGGTGRGVFKQQPLVQAYVDIKNIADLYLVKISSSALIAGAGLTLTELMNALEKHQHSDSRSQKFARLASHIRKIASWPVRNVGTWAGNLMLTHDHDGFPSDMHTILTAANASVTVENGTSTNTYNMEEFLTLDMKGKLITYLSIPIEDPTEWFVTFKVMPRHQNAHAYVNAGFNVKFTEKGKTVVLSAVLAFGGIGKHTVHGTKTEKLLKGKDLRHKATLAAALTQLSDELIPNSTLVSASPTYQKSLAISLFYKFYLSVFGDKLPKELQSAAYEMKRPVSSGQESYSTNSSKYPLTQPIPKLTAILQASGEAEYVGDIPSQQGELQGAFALTTQANAAIESITNIPKVLCMPGVVSVITARDIPKLGTNTLSGFAPQLLFAEKESQYAGQPLLLVLADTQVHADAAARAIRVTYKSHGKPIVTLEQAIKAGSLFHDDQAKAIKKGDPADALRKSAHRISGQVSAGSQYHFSMETEHCLVIPTEESLTIYSPTRSANVCQIAVAGVTGLQTSRVYIETRRCGGAFGGKFHSSAHVAAGASLAAQITKRPVRIAVDLESNMQMFGTRTPVLAKYEVGFSDSGKIDVISATVYAGCGWAHSIDSIESIIANMDNVYNIANWSLEPNSCKMNTPACQPCRSPAHFPAVFLIESIVDQVASTLSKSPEEIRFLNLYQRNQVSLSGQKLLYCNISKLWQALIKSCDFEQRNAAALSFNKDNRWKKRALAIVPLRYGISWHNHYTVMVVIYANDGTVAVTHGGVEIGQGSNTKIAQVTAYQLGCDLELVSVRASNTFTSPNAGVDGGSTTTELNCVACVNACKALNSRIKPTRTQMPKATWSEVIKACANKGIDLAAKSWVDVPKGHNGSDRYEAYGVTCSEVEIDVLTGELQISRVDLLYDCGESMNPKIDVGQTQGAFVMGLGYLLTERIVYDEDTGQLLTKNTWV